jgi:hypothetical protein
LHELGCTNTGCIKRAAKNDLVQVNLAQNIQRLLRIFYSSTWTQLCVGILIFISFIVNIVQTELDSPPDSAQQQLADSVFTWFEIVLTSVFTLEVVVNFAVNWFWPLITDAWSVRTHLLLMCTSYLSNNYL